MTVGGQEAAGVTAYTKGRHTVHLPFTAGGTIEEQHSPWPPNFNGQSGRLSQPLHHWTGDYRGFQRERQVGVVASTLPWYIIRMVFFGDHSP